MASSIPEIQTVRVLFCDPPTYRALSASQDQRYVNGYFDPIRNQTKQDVTFYFTKRPGMALLSNPGGTTGTGRGCYSWNGKLYSVIGNKIYSGTTDLGVTLSGSSGLVGFAETRPGASTQYLGINDGVKLYLISTTDVVTTITSNFPSPNTGDLVYMDGYWFVLTSTGAVYCCNIDDPTTWDPSKILTAQMYPGAGMGLARQNNYLLIFTDKSIQAFYDAGNAAGLPLSNSESAVQQIGCASGGSLGATENTVFWVSNTKAGGYSVWRMDGTAQIKEIGISPINRILSAEGSNITSCRGQVFRTGGGLFYLLTLVGANRSFLYDTDLDVWCEWTDTSGSKYPIMSFTQHNNTLVGQHYTDGKLYTISPTVTQDNGVNFTVSARTRRIDFDTIKRKFCSRLDIIGDVQSSTTPVSVQYSDDDYQTTSTARTLDMSVTRPFSRSPWGNFRRRSWQVSYTGANPFRVEAIELDVRLGVF